MDTSIYCMKVSCAFTLLDKKISFLNVGPKKIEEANGLIVFWFYLKGHNARLCQKLGRCLEKWECSTFFKCFIYYINDSIDLFNGVMFFPESKLVIRYETLSLYYRCQLLNKQ